MVPKKTQKAKVVAKFVVYQIKSLICDRSGKIVYGKAFDTVFKDLTGYKHLSRDLSRCRTDTGVLQILADVGFEEVFNMLNNESIYGCLADMTMLRYRLTELNEYFDKCNRKRRPKAKKFVKEYEKSKKLYSRGIKNLKKILGISDKDTPFDKKYGNIKGLIEYRKNGYDDDSFSIFDEDPYESRYPIYDGDNEDGVFGGGNFEEFASRMMGGKAPRKKKRPVQFNRFGLEDDDDESYSIFEDEYEEDDDDDEEYTDEYEDSINSMQNQISQLTSVVQDLVNSQTSINQSDALAAERYHRRMRNNPTPPPPHSDMVDNTIERSISQLTKLVQGLVKKQNALEDVISSIVYGGDDDEEVEYTASTSDAEGDPRIDLMRAMNPDYNKPDIKPEDMPSPYVVDIPSDSMIDEYNRRSTALGTEGKEVIEVEPPTPPVAETPNTSNKTVKK